MSLPGPPAPGGEPPAPRLGQLLQAYTQIGLVGFGGGYAVLALIRTELVVRRGWISEQRFDHIVEMTAFAPGAATVNVLAAVAYRLLGVRGMVLGTAAVLWPSFLLILGLAAGTSVLHAPWVVGALRGMELAVVALLITVVATLAQDLPRSPLLYGIAAFGFALTLAGLNPLWVVLTAATLGAADYAVRRRSLTPPPGGPAGSPGPKPPSSDLDAPGGR
jgi:chromate transporter